MHTFVLGDCLGVLILLISMLHICLQYALPLISPYKVPPQHNGNSCFSLGWLYAPRFVHALWETYNRMCHLMQHLFLCADTNLGIALMLTKYSFGARQYTLKSQSMESYRFFRWVFLWPKYPLWKTTDEMCWACYHFYFCTNIDLKVSQMLTRLSLQRLQQIDNLPILSMEESLWFLIGMVLRVKICPCIMKNKEKKASDLI